MPHRTAIYDDVPKADGASQYYNDVVGSFHGGFLNERGKPVSLDKWRFTSDDPAVIDQLAELFGGEPQQIENSKGDALSELFSEQASIPILLEGPDAVGCEFVLWSRDNSVIMRGDGQTINNGTEPDPGAGLPLAERKEKAKQGLVPEPEVTVYCRLADAPDLGIFRFVKRSAWNFERDLVRNSVYDELDDMDEDAEPIPAWLTRVPVSFVAKSGPRAGKTVSYTTTELTLKPNKKAA